ncbi:O-antigen ligase family protein [bacterium]|nr:O-antigen ligase family protein [bacterium]MBP9808395.1 O-antigen ligase family protein [bacterium]
MTALKKAPLLWPLALYALAVFLSGVFASADSLPESWNEGWKSFVSLRGILVAYLVAYQLFAHDAGARLTAPALSCLLLCGAASGIFGLIQQVFNFHPFTYPFLQATGFLNEPMSFAGLMQLTSFLALGFLMQGGYKQLPLLANKSAFLLVVLANFIGLIFASERSAWLGMICALLYVCFYISPRRFFEGLVALSLLFTLAWFTVPVVQVRLSPLLNAQSDVGVTARISVWSQAWQLFQEHPITGVGALHFPRIDLPEAIVPGHSKDLNHAHSNYLQILSTTGILGFASFLWLLVTALTVAYRQAKGPNSFYAAIGLGLLGAMVSLSVAGVFEYNFGSGQVKLIQWFLLALLLRPVPEAKLEAQASLSIDSAKQ